MLDNGGIVGNYTDIVERPSGAPVIVYQDVTNSDVKLASLVFGATSVAFE